MFLSDPESLSIPNLLLSAQANISWPNSLDLSPLFLVYILFASCILLSLLQGDDVYKSITAQDKVALWEQGLCPGLQVSDQLLQLVLPTARIAQRSCHMLRCGSAHCYFFCCFAK